MHQRTDKIHELNLTGVVFPWNDNRPVGIMIEDVEFVALYTTVEKLKDSIELMGVKEYSIKQVQDGPEFLSSFEGTGLRIALDPYLHIHEEHGPVTRFMEVKLPNPISKFN